MVHEYLVKGNCQHFQDALPILLWSSNQETVGNAAQLALRQFVHHGGVYKQWLAKKHNKFSLSTKRNKTDMIHNVITSRFRYVHLFPSFLNMSNNFL